MVDAVHRMHPDTRIAVLTSFEDRAAASAAVQAGATGFLLKDTPIDELARRLRGVATGTLVIDSRVAGAVLRPEQRLLSGHELSILELVAEGLTNREIGARLHLSHYTVKDYLTRIMRKLGTRSRAETVARAVQQGLLAGSQLSHRWSVVGQVLQSDLAAGDQLAVGPGDLHQPELLGTAAVDRCGDGGERAPAPVPRMKSVLLVTPTTVPVCSVVNHR